MLQPDQHVDSFADDGILSPSKRRPTMPDAVLDNGSSTFAVQHDPNWVYLVDEDARLITNWAADDVDAWRKHMPWRESNEDEDVDVVLCVEDSPMDADADGAAETATDGDNESLHTQGTGVALTASGRPTKRKRLAGRAVENTFLLVMDTCDLTLPFLLAGIHGSSVAQEAPTGEAPQTFSDSDDKARAAKGRQIVHKALFKA